MNENLKPCPFCGGKAELWNEKGTQAAITCIECGIEKGLQVIDAIPYEIRYAEGNEFSMETLSYPRAILDIANKELISDWNTRAVDPQLTAERATNERLREALGYSRKAIISLADHGTNIMREMGRDCDPAHKTWEHLIKPIDIALAACPEPVEHSRYDHADDALFLSEKREGGAS